MAVVSQISFRNYKCLDSVTISPLSKINILSGKNNIGKSAVLQMLKALPCGNSLDESKTALQAEVSPPSGKPNAVLTTIMEETDLIDTLKKINPSLVTNGTVNESYARVWEDIKNSRIYERVSWIFEGRPKLNEMRAEISWVDEKKKSVLRHSKTKLKVPRLTGVVSYVKNPIHRELGKVLADPKLVGEEDIALPVDHGYPFLYPHWKALSEFLNMPRFHLAAQRKAQSSATGTETHQLDENGSNLVQRLEYLNKSHPDTFAEINNFLNNMVSGIGNLVTPYVSGKTFEIAWQSKNAKISLSQCGTGIEQLVMLGTVLFAEHRKGIILLEEPENHLHPGAQDKLMHAIGENLKDDACAFITTHSPFIMQAKPETTIVCLQKGEQKRTIGSGVEGNELIDSLKELGVRASHLQFADIAVIVEGVTGVGVVEEWISKWPALNDHKGKVDISVLHINPQDAGNQEFKLESFFKLNKNIVFFVDRDEHPEDEQGSPQHEHLVQKCNSHKPAIPCVRLEQVRQIEGLFTPEAIRAVFPRDAEGWNYNTDKEEGLPPYKSFENHVAKKRSFAWDKNWNRSVARQMSAEDIEKQPDAKRLLDEVTRLAKEVVEAT